MQSQDKIRPIRDHVLIRWVPEDDYEANLKTLTTQRKRLDVLEQQLALLRPKIARYESNPTPAGQRLLQEAKESEARYAAELDKLRTEMKTEEWLTPEQIVPVLPDVTAVNARSQDKPATAPAAG